MPAVSHLFKSNQGLYVIILRSAPDVSTENDAASFAVGSLAPIITAARAKQMSSFRDSQGGSTSPDELAFIICRAFRRKASRRKERPPLPTAGCRSSKSAQLHGAPTRSKCRKLSTPGRSRTESHSKNKATSAPRSSSLKSALPSAGSWHMQCCPGCRRSSREAARAANPASHGAQSSCFDGHGLRGKPTYPLAAASESGAAQSQDPRAPSSRSLQPPSWILLQDLSGALFQDQVAAVG